ncbi:MAG: GntR family transcriptional regulator [Bacteroidales bacterium]|nr:GntR family transcriptional regulator [Bacteroidales bacterium]
MDFNKNKPIYLQIVDLIYEKILSGEFHEGDRILSVRELGIELGVNPNTVMRSFELMQRNGVIATKRGIGFYICENAKQIVLNEQKKDFIENELPAFFKKLELYGMTIEDIKKYK